MSGESERSEIHVDEDWKSKVKAEDAAFDEQLRQAESSAQGDPSTGTFPPADFAGLVMMLSTQAMVGLGFVPMPGQNQPSKNLGMAKYFIDLLAMLEDKTKNKLSREENNLLIETLHQLRMGFVQASQN
jgi:hypothetical protein